MRVVVSTVSRPDKIKPKGDEHGDFFVPVKICLENVPSCRGTGDDEGQQEGINAKYKREKTDQNPVEKVLMSCI